MLALDRERPDPAVIAEAAACLRAGGLVVLPTETVYGLGANALDPLAIAAVFDAKGRPATDPLIVHVSRLDDLAAIVTDVTPLVRRLAAAFWPGPLTLILPKRGVVPEAVTAGLPTVAVRVPAHPVALAVIAAAGVPVAAPSANLFSRPSPTLASHVLADLAGRVDLVLDAGPTEVGIESTVLDLTVNPPLVRRPGGVTLEALRQVVADVQLLTRHEDSGIAQASPGQLLRHYAPRARLTLIDGNEEGVRRYVATEAVARAHAGLRVGVLAPAEDILALRTALAAAGRIVLQPYGSRRDPAQCARELFEAVRVLDGAEVAEMLAIAPAPTGLGLAVHDRLTRAAEGRVVRIEGTGPEGPAPGHSR